MVDFRERIQDEKYQELLGEMLDQFFSKAKDAKLAEVVKSEAKLDMVEILLRYASDHFEPKESMILMLMLGVYLAHHDAAILPLDIN